MVPGEAAESAGGGAAAAAGGVVPGVGLGAGLDRWWCVVDLGLGGGAAPVVVGAGWRQGRGGSGGGSAAGRAARRKRRGQRAGTAHWPHTAGPQTCGMATKSDPSRACNASQYVVVVSSRSQLHPRPHLLKGRSRATGERWAGGADCGHEQRVSGAGVDCILLECEPCAGAEWRGGRWCWWWWWWW